MSTLESSNDPPWSAPRPPVPALPMLAAPDPSVAWNEFDPVLASPFTLANEARAISPIARDFPLLNTPCTTPAWSTEKLISDPLAKPSCVELATAEAAANCVKVVSPGANPFHVKVWLEAPFTKPVIAMGPILAAGAVNWPAPLKVTVPVFKVTGVGEPTSAPGIVTV